MTESHLPPPDEVLSYWLGDALQQDWPSDNRGRLWFGGGAALDAQIRERFGALVEAAVDGRLTEWEHPLAARLALVIVLDQFTRNVFRGQARAFAGDGRAQQLVQQTLAQGQDAALPRAARVFLYMPLMHAESGPLQETSVQKFTALLADAPPALRDTLAGHLRFAEEHRDIVRRFGRFPHRNAALGRTSTAEETRFLVSGPRYGQ